MFALICAALRYATLIQCTAPSTPMRSPLKGGRKEIKGIDRNNEMMRYFCANRPLQTLSKAPHPDDVGIRCELRECLSSVLHGRWEGDITDGAKRDEFSFSLEDGLGLGCGWMDGWVDGWVNVAAVCVCKLFCVK